MFDLIKPRRSYLPPYEALKSARIYLENALNEKNVENALALCDDAKDDLERALRKSGTSQHTTDQALGDEIASFYFDLGKVLGSLNPRKAQDCYKKVEKWRGRVESDLLVPQPYNDDLQPTIASSASSNSLSQLIFLEDVRPFNAKCELPKVGSNLKDTAQLRYCLSLLKYSPAPDDGLERDARDWREETKANGDEEGRLESLASTLVMALGKPGHRTPSFIEEVVFLAPVLEKEDFLHLLRRLVEGFDQSPLLDPSALDGLAQLIQGAGPSYLGANDLVTILGLISSRLQATHGQSPSEIYLLTQAISNVLDAMSEIHIKDLDRVKLHEPLLNYLRDLQGSKNPYLAYQAAYASQALLYVPDNEKPWEKILRRGGKVLGGVFGMVSAVKSVDVNGFIDGLKKIQDGMTGVGQFFSVAKDACDGVISVYKSGQELGESFKEFRFDSKKQWYTALRGADVLLQSGQLIEFQSLVLDSPCRSDPNFQRGVSTRQRCVDFLGEIYRNDGIWGQEPKVKEWILDILIQLSTPSGGDIQGGDMPDAASLLKALQSNGDAIKQTFYKECRKKVPGLYPLRAVSLPRVRGAQSLLSIIQNEVDFENDLLYLKGEHQKDNGKSIYIPPQAKANLKARDVDSSPLMEKVEAFLESEQKVFLILGDSGAGKSTFSKTLERVLWNKYRKGSRTPLYIRLSEIEKPENDLITKQLIRNQFTPQQIKEMKKKREFILICDGYDESTRTNNLYTCNRFDQSGEWKAKMIISCRTEYLERGYRDDFQISDSDGKARPDLFQEAVIVPFSPMQIKDYIKQYMSLEEKPLWEEANYNEAFKRIPNLKELVKNPFLLKMSLDVLPDMVDLRQEFSAVRINQISLYDRFLKLWIRRGKERLLKKTKGEQEQKAFRCLQEDGFMENSIEHFKKLAATMYKKGITSIEYNRTQHETIWRKFFGQDDDTRLLFDVCPISRNGNIYRFIHRSIQEYGVARAVFEPTESEDSADFYSGYGEQDVREDEEVAIRQPLLNNIFAERDFAKEASILQFLVGRALQEPHFRQQLHAVIRYSKVEEKASRAAANAITILVRAGVSFNGADLQGIRIPGADLGYGVFDSANLQDANLKDVVLRNVWFREANLSGAQMEGVQFGELPFLKLNGDVAACAYSIDGTRLAVALSCNIVIYDTSSGKELQSLPGHSKSVTCVTFSPNENRVASSSCDNTVRLWNPDNQKHRILHGHSHEVLGVIYSPNGSQLGSASKDGTVRLWDIQTEECRQILDGHSDSVNRVIYSPKGSLIASCSDDNTVRLWSVETGECLNLFEGHGDDVLGIAFSPKEDQIASGSSDSTVRLWDIETGKCIHVLKDHGSQVYSVAYSMDGGQIASSSSDKTVRLWDVKTGECDHILKGHEGCVVSVVYSPKGDQIATGGRDETVRLWEIETGKSQQSPDSHSKGVKCVAYSPDCSQIASGSKDETVRLWDVKTGKCCRTLKGHKGIVTSVDYSPGGCQIASGSYDRTVRLWGVKDGEFICSFKGHTDIISAVSFSPTGDRIVTSGWDSKVRLWDVKEKQCLYIIEGGRNWVASAMYSPKGDLVVGGIDDHTVRLWDVNTKKSRCTLEGHTGGVWSVAFSHSGDQIASGSDDCKVLLWDINTNECLRALVGHTKRVICVAYSPTDDMIVSSSEDRTIILWDAASGQRKEVIENQGVVNTVAWKSTTDGTYLVTGSDDASVRLWRLVKDGDRYILRLRWSSTHGGLVLPKICIEGVRGLNEQNHRLLMQRGAVGKPLSPLPMNSH
ncbi:hypothetical protein BGZ80_000080 [Entomortierella chlamydospora]|uniref:Uncharacterized protein n=1 Tax=Entomortierella chlamydospora TaxID=101097 RepID=A0A9P6N3J9_9FUNG|nr:hypothetical protein BGZ80_000080 [Entomortierella chlamydospora]